MFKSYYVVWKQHTSIEGKYIPLLFKSYYVVWKLWGENIATPSKYSLNRTMQYGNLWNTFSYMTTQYLFKSYYVVWKHTYNVSDANDTVRFKSYYVVWKPRVYMHVWLVQNSLNRTMQYGNNHMFIQFVSVNAPFKSYYVVWKPIKVWVKNKGTSTFKSYYVVWKLSMQK